VGVLLLAPWLAFAGDAPRWPLDAPPVLTSSFGEFRATHFHAGLDLGTGGRVGVACRAVDGGSIVRMRMSPFGYGKALYLQLDSGPLVVYAHLSRFAAPMAQRARDEQRRHQRYSFDIEIPRGTMRVEAGEVIAWSGQTGVGFPHLHFEMRDGDVARNPQTAGFAVRDTIAPVIAALYATPMDPHSQVAGGTATQKVPFGTAGTPIVVGGRITLRAATTGKDRIGTSCVSTAGSCSVS
jgi:murein DD-endopeptidase MepM/ murein hydrolase activator NlpD